MKTEAQLQRTEDELDAVSNAMNATNYYIRPYYKGLNAYQKPWSEYCRMLDSKLGEELRLMEINHVRRSVSAQGNLSV